MRVLLIKTSSLGDVVHTLPALTDAQAAIPGIRFDWLVEEAFAEIPRWHPAVAEVIPVAIRRWRKQPVQTWRSGAWREFKRDLGRRQYDLIIDAQGLVKSAVLTRLNPAPSAGYDRASIREPLASRFYQHGYTVARQQHAVERIRALFALALDYPRPTTVGDYGIDVSRLPAVEVPSEAYVVFCHGTTWETKHWPESYWRQLAEAHVRDGLRVLLPWGNEPERLRAERIAADLPGVRVLPRMTLFEMAAVLSRAARVIAVDTGLGHLAAAVAAPSVALYGPTNPELTGSYGRQQRVLASTLPCAPCLSKSCKLSAREQAAALAFPPCLAELTAERVAAAARQVADKDEVVEKDEVKNGTHGASDLNGSA